MINIPQLTEHIYDVVGAIFEVHKELGPGLNEYVYQEGLEMELTERNIVFERSCHSILPIMAIKWTLCLELIFYVKGILWLNVSLLQNCYQSIMPNCSITCVC